LSNYTRERMAVLEDKVFKLTKAMNDLLNELDAKSERLAVAEGRLAEAWNNWVQGNDVAMIAALRPREEADNEED
jgi:hypothetical protein